MTVFPNDTAEWWVYLIMTFFVMLGPGLVVAYLNWFVVVNENEFVYRTFWRKTYQIAYSDISRVKASENMIVIWAKNKRFFIDSHAVGIETFIQHIKKRT